MSDRQADSGYINNIQMKKVNKSLSNTTNLDKLLYEWFSAKIDMQNQLDHVKSQLISHSKFNLVDLFQKLDQRKTRAISGVDIETFFKNVGLKVSSLEIQAVLRYFTDKENIEFNGFFMKLMPLTARPVSRDDSSVDDLLCKLFLLIIEHTEAISKAKADLSAIESLNMELICQDHKQFTIEDLDDLFKKYGGWTISHENGRVVFGSKLRLNRRDLCSMIGIEFKQNSIVRSMSKGTEETHDQSLKPRNSEYRRTFSNSFFQNEVNFFVDNEMTQYEREMLYE